MYFCSGLSTRTLHAAGAALHQSLASNCRSCSVGSPGKRKRAIQRACKFAFSSMNSMPATEERIVVGPDIGGGILGPRSREQTETNAKGRRRRKRALRKSIDGGEKWASTAVGSTRSSTAAPKAARVAPDGRRARRVRRTANASQRWREIISGEVVRPSQPAARPRRSIGSSSARLL